MMVWALPALAAGYGVPVDGLPSAVERELQLWTNAARVAPEEFEEEYESAYEPCTLDDFEADEREPKDPLYIDMGLTEAARFHSDDMHDNGCFQHESCDGTDTWERIGRFYDEGGALGENIAAGSSDPRYSVMSMWMCSTGHRANIMNGEFDEMGAGVNAEYMTQDFADGELSDGEPPVRIAAEIDGTVHCDFADDAPPARLEVVQENSATPMALAWGADERGIYVADLEGEEPWVVAWEADGGEAGTFPAEGGFAGDAWEENGPDVGRRADDDDDDWRLTGCASGAGSGTGAPRVSLLMGLAAVSLRRRPGVPRSPHPTNHRPPQGPVPVPHHRG